jgi:hypothetical protein
MAEHPRDELGRLLRRTLHCPACGPPLESMLVPVPMQSRNGSSSIRVIAYRQKSIRLECRECELRFSIDPVNFAKVRARQMTPPREMVEEKARHRAGGNPSAYLGALADVRESANRFVREERDRVVSLHLDGLKSTTPRRRPIRFPKR